MKDSGFALSLAAILAWSLSNASAAQLQPAPDCASIANLQIDAHQIKLPTGGARIISADLQTAQGDTEPVCVVKGAVAPVDPAAPPVNFQLNLPQRWNGKAIQFGGGGFDGTVVSGRNPQFIFRDREPVRLGYATFGSDSGHSNTSKDRLASTADASFALNRESLLNYAGEQIKKTHDAVIAIIKRYYGQTPRRMYFYGASQGGHEGLIAAQRYGADYDGVIAIHPAYDLAELLLSSVAVGQTIYSRPGAWVSPEKLKSLHQAVLAKCDALDGVEDGLVSNTAACDTAFDLSSLRCADGNDTGATCLTDAQLASVQTLAMPLDFGAEIGGQRIFPGWPILHGAFGPGSRFGLGNRFPPSSPPSLPQDAFSAVMGDQGIRYFVLRDAAFNSLSFRTADHLDAIRQAAAILDANSTDLDLFRKHGGKLILMHGTVDMAIPPGNSINYFRKLEKRYGAQLPSFTRFYITPGFGHGDGDFQVQWDMLTTLDLWVENGVIPANLVVKDATAAGAGRTRPLCEFPGWPKYNGSGDPNQAANFTCAR